MRSIEPLKGRTISPHRQGDVIRLPAHRHGARRHLGLTGVGIVTALDTPSHPFVANRAGLDNLD
jgi:hypothetical protein